ncbi:MAG: radical SAM/SPASM family putative metalloenzyme maturase [Proteobacteria bacterium]|nr:radical SAM/SPASM family putative metalloenzyme maturase [Pseudomonadota bacterium]
MNDLSPQKIHVEITTRCNLHCRMCVKHAEGSRIPEEDMSLDMFKRLAPALVQVRKLVLNGIGEPLLHPDLLEMVRFARLHMPPSASIGFQSNGLLLTYPCAKDLIEAGLSTICLSLDSLQTQAGREQVGGHGVAAVAKAIAALSQARKELTGNFRIGLEMVLTSETVAELPDMVRWAAEQGVDYILTTHLLLYDAASEELSLFNPNTRNATQLFNKYVELAAAEGLNLKSGLAAYLKLSRTAKDQRMAEMFGEMQKEASDKDIRLHLQSLIRHRDLDPTTVEQLFRVARNLAEKANIEIFLPPLQSEAEKSCAFIAEKATFLTAGGAVMPCYFLWHTYSCRVLQEYIQVQERSFGNIRDLSLQAIWQSPEYRKFRREAGDYEYAPCWSCSQGPCITLVNDNLLSANDCYGSQVPCGHCQWNLGGIRCL